MGGGCIFISCHTSQAHGNLFRTSIKSFLLILYIFHQQVFEGSSKENNPTVFFILFYFISFTFYPFLKGENKNKEEMKEMFLKFFFFKCNILCMICVGL